MAQILSLPHPSPLDTPIDQETKRRVYWTLYMVDRWNSAGLGLTRQLPDGLKHPMPAHELEFHQPGFRYHSNLKRGLWAYFIDLACIFSDIQDLHSRHVSGELEDAHFEEQAQSLAAMLERFADGLPAELRLNVDNLQWHADHGIGRTFVALHLGFHHYSTLIHFQYLDIQLPRTPKQRLFASRCKHHANTYSDLLKLSTEIPHCDAVYNIVGHMTVVSSSVLLYTLFFGDEDELPTTRQRLEQNFQVLIKLRSYWPSVSDMVSLGTVNPTLCKSHSLPDGPSVHLPKSVHVVRRPEHAQDRQVDAKVPAATRPAHRRQAGLPPHFAAAARRHCRDIVRARAIRQQRFVHASPMTSLKRSGKKKKMLVHNHCPRKKKKHRIHPSSSSRLLPMLHPHPPLPPRALPPHLPLPHPHHIRLHPIKQPRNLLQRRPPRLHIQPPNRHALAHQHRDIHEIKPPRQRVQPDGIDVLVEDGRRRRGSHGDGEPLGADAVGQDLGAVGDGQAGPGEAGGAVKGEDHGDDGRAGGFVGRVGVDGGAACFPSVSESWRFAGQRK